MKSASKKRAPTILNLTVKRRYLAEREVELTVAAMLASTVASRRNHDPGRLYLSRVLFRRAGVDDSGASPALLAVPIPAAVRPGRAEQGSRGDLRYRDRDRKSTRLNSRH